MRNIVQESLRVLVEPRVRQLDVQGQGGNHVRGIRDNSKRRDVSVHILRVERLKSPYLDEGLVCNRSLVLQQLGNTGEQLGSRFRVSGHKLVVQWLLERDLDLHGTVRDGLVCGTGGDGLR